MSALSILILYVNAELEPGALIGCDFSGTVAKLGNNTTAQVEIGDHVAGFIQGGGCRCATLAPGVAV